MGRAGMPVRPVRLFSCDDDPSFTRLLGLWLEDCADVRLVGAAHTREACLAGVRETEPDVVLLDSMAGPGSGPTVGDVRRAAPHAAVVVYSGYEPGAAPGVGAGEPDAFLRKEADAAALVALVRALLHR